ncbi:hypothetical protein BD410DRAFT_805448 [Rickenella mellea]|uniref:Uncharacterized protein n=1 Tax=Rickenella mellea TaxID=50990 RepID=A0A4Y7PWJ7_9AGAM|nr:hypothetical protein BD410DRAFT_805448 [Rickenella mellea]
MCNVMRSLRNFMGFAIGQMRASGGFEASRSGGFWNLPMLQERSRNAMSVHPSSENGRRRVRTSSHPDKDTSTIRPAMTTLIPTCVMANFIRTATTTTITFTLVPSPLRPYLVSSRTQTGVIPHSLIVSQPPSPTNSVHLRCFTTKRPSCGARHAEGDNDAWRLVKGFCFNMITLELPLDDMRSVVNVGEHMLHQTLFFWSELQLQIMHTPQPSRRQRQLGKRWWRSRPTRTCIFEHDLDVADDLDDNAPTPAYRLALRVAPPTTTPQSPTASPRNSSLLARTFAMVTVVHFM